jgi:hypothetical protein
MPRPRHSRSAEPPHRPAKSEPDRKTSQAAGTTSPPASAAKTAISVGAAARDQVITEPRPVLVPREVVTLPGDQPVESGAAHARVPRCADEPQNWPAIRSSGPSCSYLTPAGGRGGAPRICSSQAASKI